MNYLNEEQESRVVNQRLAYIADRTNEAIPMGRRSLVLSGESAAAIFGSKAQMDQPRRDELSNVQSQAANMVDSIANSWNNELKNEARLRTLLGLTGENASNLKPEQISAFRQRAEISPLAKQFAAQAIVAATCPNDYVMVAENAHGITDRFTGTNKAIVVQRGFFDRTLANMAMGRMGDNLKLTGENFSESVNAGTLTRYAVTFHASAQRQEAAVEAAYQTLLLPIDQLGVHITVRVNTVIRNAFHEISGSLFNLARENVLNALVHPEDFFANQTKVIPVYIDSNAENAAHFVSPILATPRVINYDRVPKDQLTEQELKANQYRTNYLKLGEAHNIIGLAQPTQALNGGQRSMVDTINPAVFLKEILFVHLDPAAPTDLTKAETFAYEVGEISSAYAVESFSADSRDVQFNFYTKQLCFSPRNLLEMNSDGSIKAYKTANGKPAPRTEKLIYANPADISTHLRVEFGVSISGRLSLSMGTAELTATRVTLNGVTNVDVRNPIRYNDGSPEWIAAQEYINSLVAVGVDIDATFENLGAREYGTRIDSVDMRHYIETSMHPPITAIGQIASNNQETIQQDRFATLQFHAFALQSGRGIEHIKKHFERLDREYRGETRLEMRPVTTLGVASYNVNPFYRYAEFDVADLVAAEKTHELVDELRAFITNITCRWAAEAETESRFQIWRDCNYGGQAPAPTVLFINDPILNPYLYTPGDTRMLGDRYPFLTYQTYNHEFRGKLAMLFVDPSNNNGGPNNLSHGNTLSKAEVVMKLPVWRNGSTIMELGLAQCFRHISHLPLGCEIEIKNVDKLLTNKVYRSVKITDTVNTHAVP